MLRISNHTPQTPPANAAPLTRELASSLAENSQQAAGQASSSGATAHPTVAPTQMQAILYKLNEQGEQAPVTHFGFGKIFQGLINERYASAGLGVNIAGRNENSVQTLRDQGGAYSLAETGSNKTDVVVFHNIDHINSYGDDEGASNIIRDIASGDTKIISMSVTDRPYTMSENEVNRDAETVAKSTGGEIGELKSPFGVILAGLKDRFEASGGDSKPPILFAFENKADAPDLAKSNLVNMARAAETTNPELRGFGDYVDTLEAPHVMIDRIVPGRAEGGRTVSYPDGTQVQDEIAQSTEDYGGLVAINGTKPDDLPDIEGFKWVPNPNEFNAIKKNKQNLLNAMHAAAAIANDVRGDDSRNPGPSGGASFQAIGDGQAVDRHGRASVLPTLVNSPNTGAGLDRAWGNVISGAPNMPALSLGPSEYQSSIKGRFQNTGIKDGGEPMGRLSAERPRRLNNYLLPAIVDTLKGGGQVDALMGFLVTSMHYSQQEVSQAQDAMQNGSPEEKANAEKLLQKLEPHPVTKDAILASPKITDDVRPQFEAAFNKAENRFKILSQAANDNPAVAADVMLRPKNYAGIPTEQLFESRGLNFQQFLDDPKSLNIEAPDGTAILLDNDGTIVDSEVIALPTAQRLVNEIVTGMTNPAGVQGQEVSQEDFSSKYAGMNFSLILRSVLQDQGFDPMTADQIEHWEAVEDERIVEALTDPTTGVKPTNSAVEAVKAMKASPIGQSTLVATSASMERAKASLDHVGLLSTIGGSARVFSGAALGQPKPDPAVYLHAMAQMNIPTTAVKVAVEDSGSGAKSAMAAGITALAGMVGGDHIVGEGRQGMMTDKLMDLGASFVTSDLAQVLIAGHDHGLWNLSMKSD